MALRPHAFNMGDSCAPTLRNRSAERVAVRNTKSLLVLRKQRRRRGRLAAPPTRLRGFRVACSC